MTTVSPVPAPEPGFYTAEGALFDRHYRALQKQSGRLVPPRSAFTPSSARTLLPYIAILEVRGPMEIFVRLVGTAVINRGRVDMTSKNLLDYYPSAARDWAWQHHMRMLEKPCGSTFLSREEFNGFVTHTEIVNFPLADETGAARFIIGVAVETDRKELLLRGNASMELAAFTDQRYLDIGAGA